MSEKRTSREAVMKEAAHFRKSGAPWDSYLADLLEELVDRAETSERLLQDTGRELSSANGHIHRMVSDFRRIEKGILEGAPLHRRALDRLAALRQATVRFRDAAYDQGVRMPLPLADALDAALDDADSSLQAQGVLPAASTVPPSDAADPSRHLAGCRKSNDRLMVLNGLLVESVSYTRDALERCVEVLGRVQPEEPGLIEGDARETVEAGRRALAFLETQANAIMAGGSADILLSHERNLARMRHERLLDGMRLAALLARTFSAVAESMEAAGVTPAEDWTGKRLADRIAQMIESYRDSCALWMVTDGTSR